ncbi:MAG: hypothetical protein COU63_03335 [Candidatus Pacebacteria bacterium CG10_big_fil_rev_8_21_14_0_10_36_11]|nr:hypothetical protein [Candidatus Pacearchaeota archaeon]PIR65022.1 MAG: hypothetical protein COU63_03335 [Candidatus Pacebacteria bacterium CG10_big_fil_rev_8_21_14_0_10_36_11]
MVITREMVAEQLGINVKKLKALIFYPGLFDTRFNSIFIVCDSELGAIIRKNVEERNLSAFRWINIRIYTWEELQALPWKNDFEYAINELTLGKELGKVLAYWAIPRGLLNTRKPGLKV